MPGCPRCRVGYLDSEVHECSLNGQSQSRTIAAVVFAVITPFLIETAWTLLFSNARVMEAVYRITARQPLLTPVVLMAVWYVSCVGPGFVFLVRRWGWSQSLLVGFVCFPVMGLLMLVYGFAFTHGI